ncbi:MAG: type II toxin-antitoxin system PemK/MazF family toxin [Iamia sp.]
MMRAGDLYWGVTCAAGERPYLILTRTAAIEVLDRITVAPCSTRIRGIPTELPLGSDAGLDHESVAQLDSIMPVMKASLHHRLGRIGPDGHAELCDCLALAFGCG